MAQVFISYAKKDYIASDGSVIPGNFVDKLIDAFREEGITYWLDREQLAGGEQQRVALARALVNQPKLLLADEPTGNLDLYNTAEIMRLLETINENGTTVVVVTHNDKLVNDMKKRVVTIKQGMIVSDAENGGYFDED